MEEALVLLEALCKNALPEHSVTLKGGTQTIALIYTSLTACGGNEATLLGFVLIL